MMRFDKTYWYALFKKSKNKSMKDQRTAKRPRLKIILTQRKSFSCIQTVFISFQQTEMQLGLNGKVALQRKLRKTQIN